MKVISSSSPPLIPPVRTPIGRQNSIEMLATSMKQTAAAALGSPSRSAMKNGRLARKAATVI